MIHNARNLAAKAGQTYVCRSRAPEPAMITLTLLMASFFLPTIIRGFATTFETTYSVMQVGLITAIPFAFGAAAMVLWSRHSDRTGP